MTDATLVKTPSQAREIWDQFRQHRGAMIGLGFLIFITLFVIVGPYLWDLDPTKSDIRNKN